MFADDPAARCAGHFRSVESHALALAVFALASFVQSEHRPPAEGEAMHVDAVLVSAGAFAGSLRVRRPGKPPAEATGELLSTTMWGKVLYHARLSARSAEELTWMIPTVVKPEVARDRMQCPRTGETDLHELIGRLVVSLACCWEAFVSQLRVP